MNKSQSAGMYVILGIMILAFVSMLLAGPNTSTQDISYTSFLQKLNSGAIKSVEIDRDSLIAVPKVQPKETKKASNNIGKTLYGEQKPVIVQYHVLTPSDSGLMKKLEDANVTISVKKPSESSQWMNILGSLILPILFIVFIIIMIKSVQAGGSQAMSFGKSKAKMMLDNKVKITFNDVAGIDEEKQELEEIVDFLKNGEKYIKLGAKIPKGVLLVGVPGTGKTLMAKAVAGEAGVPFFSISGSDFVEMFVGVGASRVRDLFDQAKKHQPCIIFIDEIDAVGRQRGAGLGGGHDEREQTLNQLLVEMDGFTSNEGVILIAATNRPDVLDKALLRPGRFDRQIMVGLPDLRGREAILNVHLKKRKVPLAKDVDVRAIAKGTPGLAGADLENLINEAALLAARFNNKQVSQLDFEEARDKLAMGAERRSLLMTDEEKRHTAYHEAGHALMTLLCPHSDPLHKITIIPRGRALGITMSLPENDRVSLSKEAAEENIMILMSGRLAELIAFNHQSTGASNDIQRATELARKMVTEWGFDDKIGPLCYSRTDGEIFLGREINKPKEMSEKMAEMIDDAVNSLVLSLTKKARKLLEDHRDKLDALGESLFENEVLDREEVDRVMNGEKLESTKKSRQYLSQKRKAEEAAKAEEPPPDPGRPAADAAPKTEEEAPADPAQVKAEDSAKAEPPAEPKPEDSGKPEDKA